MNTELSYPTSAGGYGILVKVIEDSIAPVTGIRLTTLQLRYPRFVHSEFMTHRCFSRNASSSRAIPIEKMIEQVETEPACPMRWGSNKKGMQAGEDVENVLVAMRAWRAASLSAVEHARRLQACGLHKQIVNRVLEPFQWINVIVTATDWGNFLRLRNNELADPTIHLLAKYIQTVLETSKPVEREAHLPYLTSEERVLPPAPIPLSFKEDDPKEVERREKAYEEYSKASSRLFLISAARCARVSYNNHDGSDPDAEKDLALADVLYTSGHWSPFEHQAFPMSEEQVSSHMNKSRNFYGWNQARGMFDHYVEPNRI